MTRARDRLDLLQPERFYVTGQAATATAMSARARSRFLPNGILHLFEHVAAGGAAGDAPPSSGPAAARRHRGGVQADVGLSARANEKRPPLAGRPSQRSVGASAFVVADDIALVRTRGRT